MDTVEDRPEDAQVLREPRSPTGGEKTVKGQLLKIAVVLSVFLLIVWLFGFVFVAEFPPLPQGRALGWHGEIDEGSYVLTIISVGGYTESEKQLDKWWIRIVTPPFDFERYTHVVLEPMPILDMDSVEGISFVDAEPHGIISRYDQVLIDISFFEESARYEVRLGLYDPSTGTWDSGADIRLDVEVPA